MVGISTLEWLQFNGVKINFSFIRMIIVLFHSLHATLWSARVDLFPCCPFLMAAHQNGPENREVRTDKLSLSVFLFPDDGRVLRLTFYSPQPNPAEGYKPNSLSIFFANN